MLAIHAIEGEWSSVPAALGEVEFQQLIAFASRANRDILRRTRDSLGGRSISIDRERRSIRFDGLAGLVKLGQCHLSVRPKFLIGGDMAEPLARLAMIDGRTLTSRVIIRPESFPALSGSSWADPIAVYFAQRLIGAIEQGPLLLSERQSEFGSRMRGRLLITKQVTSAPYVAHRLFYSYSKLNRANQAVALLRWACERLLSLSQHPVAKSRLRAALALLPPTAGRPLPASIARITSLPTAAPYREVLKIAHELHRRGVWEEAGDKGERKSWGFLVVTHAAFEHLVSASFRVASRSLGLRHEPQHAATLRTLRSHTPPVTRRRVIYVDDALVARGMRVVLASESKYVVRSILREAQHRDHFNQILASCIASGATRGLLVYPDMSTGSPGTVERWVTNSDVLARELPIGVMYLRMGELRHREFRAALAKQIQMAVSAILRPSDDDTQLPLL